MAAEVPVSLLWSKLQKMRDEERFVFPGLRNRVVTAVNELEKILNFLKASKPSHEIISISAQETTLLHTIYSAEHFTESFLLQRRRKGVIQIEMPLAFSSWTQLWFSFNMMKLVRGVRAVSREFEKTHGLPDGQEIDALTTHNIDVAKQADPLSSPLEPSPIIEQEPDAIVEREDEVEELVSRLINHNDDSLRVISVVGDEAVGKTALARNVFNRLDIRQHFPRRAWLHVSGDLAYKDRLLIILKQIPTSELKDLELMREDELSDMLFKFLMRYRFLIVLDDVQDQPVGVWHELFRCFGDAVNGSRVILTTRHFSVAIKTDRWSSPLKLRPLNEEKSWSLFLKKVSRPDSTELNNLKGDILRICDGLPLAIVLLGGFLSALEFKEWSSVIGLAVQQRGSQSPLANIVDFGYDQLPYVLKPCFLYLALFPKAYEIPIRRLLQLWLAEGFVQSKPDGRIPEDEAKRYLEELVRRNMIEIAKWKSDGSPKTCRMPTYLYDDFLPKANDIGFLHVHHCKKTDCTSTDSPESYIPRLADKFGVESSTSKSHIRKLRSYVSFNSEKRDTSNSGIGMFLKTMIKRRGFVLLKVLDLEGVYKPLLPKKLGKLQNLRYLGLRWTGLDRCPESVGDLPCLETLDLKYTNVTTLPSSIWRAKKLRHLFMNEMFIQKPPKRSSPNLLTLMELHIGANSPDKYGLHKFTSLRKLGLTCHSKSAEETAKCISKLVNLQTLRLKSRDPFGQPVELVLEPMKEHRTLSNLYLFGQIKDGIVNIPRHLRTLTLSMSELEEDPMPMLGVLPQLSILRLFACSYAKSEMTCHAGNFPNLRVLKMWKLEELEQLKVEQGAMPQLVELEIRVCKKMKSLDGLEELATLKELILTDMPQDFIKDVRRRISAHGDGIVWDKMRQATRLSLSLSQSHFTNKTENSDLEAKSPKIVIPTVVSSIMFIKKKRLMEVFPSRWSNLWTEWQLRLLILLSLTAQIILVILGNRRKYIAGAWIRFTVWSTYLLADSIALMAAGIISNDVGEVYNANGLVDEKHELIIFWAPLLLLHLGGTDTITAYSLEDNELWKRHLLGVVIQAFATLYIWLTAWTSSTLSLLFILMFFVGLGKYCERVWVLYLASEKTFRESIPDIPTNDSKIMEKCKLKQLEGYHLTTHQVFEVEVPDHSANTSSTDESLHPHADELLTAYSLVDMVKRLFSDLILGYQDRDASREIFERLSSKKAFKVIEIELGFIYDLLYTKAKAIYSPWGIARRIIGIFIIFIVLVLFIILRVREIHQRSKIDVIITLVLLVVALLLELCAFRELLLSDHTTHWLIKHKKTNFLQHINRTLRHKWQKRRNWSHSISQFSLLSFSLGQTPVPYYGILKMLGIDEMLEIQPYDIPLRDIDDIKYIIFEDMKNLRDWAKVNNCCTELKDLYGRKGGRTLTRYKREDLDWSVDKLGFDQSILIWHLATEICYFHEYIKPEEISTTVNSEGKRESQNERSAKGLMRQRCNYLSRYMLYLLVRRPNMLPIGMGHIKFRDIYTEVGDFIEEHNGKSVKDEKEASDTLSKVKTKVMLAVGGRDRSRRDRSNNVIFHACKLVSALGEDEKKWELIKNVWLEMLGHAASQCKGRLHAQQLRRGGELLTHVWLLMAHFGLTDHFQIPRSRAIAEAIIR